MTDNPNKPIHDDDEGEVRVYDAPTKPVVGGSGMRLVWGIVIIIIVLLLLWWIF